MFKIITVITLVLCVKVNSLFIKSRSIEVNSRILEKFINHYFIIHFDDETSDKLNQIFAYPNPKLIYNYDKDRIIDRPQGNKFVNLVYLTDAKKFGKYIQVLSNSYFEDVITIFTSNFSRILEGNITDMPGMERVGAVIVIDVVHDEYYDTKYFFGNESKILKKIASSNANLPELSRSVNTFKNFNGHTFQVGYSHHRPFAWCK